MHLKLAILTMTIGILAQVGLCEKYDHDKAKTLFLTKCSTCHGIDDYDLGSRSLKEWQLVVERMSNYGTGEEYTDEEADQIIAFLYGETHQSKLTTGQSETAIPVTTSNPPAPAVAASAAATPEPKLRISWRKSKATGVARIMGYVAMGIMGLMVLTGLARTKLKRNFRPVHTVLAIALFGALSIHVSVYLCEYGTPNVLWLWFGIAAAVLIGLVEFGGLVRAKLGVKFIRIHSICGIIGFVLVLLHWLWIYL